MAWEEIQLKKEKKEQKWQKIIIYFHTVWCVPHFSCQTVLLREINFKRELLFALLQRGLTSLSYSIFLIILLRTYKLRLGSTEGTKASCSTLTWHEESRRRPALPAPKRQRKMHPCLNRSGEWWGRETNLHFRNSQKEVRQSNQMNF